MSELARFQDDFAAALATPDHRLGWWIEPGSAGLAVYRNMVTKGAIDALAANFPTVERLVGEAWFRAAAREFTAIMPPGEPTLMRYGAGFADWLARFPPAEFMPYLAEAARLDRLWTQTHLAADAAPLAPEALAGLDLDGLERTRALLHPSARFAWFESNMPSLWLANRPPAAAPDSFAFTDRPEGVLIVRPSLAVRARVLDAGRFAFVAGCASGQTLAAAAASALSADAAADLAAIISACLEDGLFVALQPGGGTCP